MGMVAGCPDDKLHIREIGVVDHLLPVRGEAGGGDVDPGSLAVDWQLWWRRDT